MKALNCLRAPALTFGIVLLIASCSHETGGKPYPLDACIVSGEKLGTMGDPIKLNYKGQQVAFCCAHCKPEFEKDPEKYLTKLPK